MGRHSNRLLPAVLALALLAPAAAPRDAAAAVEADCRAVEPPVGGPPLSSVAFVGFLKRVEGGVLIHRAGEAAPLMAKPAMRVYPFDAIESGNDGAFDILFTDSTSVSAIPKTCLKVAEYAYTPGEPDGRFQLELDRGVVAIGAGDIAKLRYGAMDVTVRKDTNLVVKGTRFVVRAQ